jgi:outer membrane protein OmpA-like peptidoglycan-associated protein
MRPPATLAIIAATLMPCIAMAQPINGLYVSGDVLWNGKLIEPIAPDPAIGLGSSERFRFNAGGYGALAAVGVGLGTGLRLEVEGDIRANTLRRFYTAVPNTGSSSQQDYGLMFNALYDFDLSRYGITAVVPYLGAGAGYQWSHLNGLLTIRTNGLVSHVGGTSGQFAYQGIVGTAFPIAAVPGLSLTAEYRFLGIQGQQTFPGEVNSGPVNLKDQTAITENFNHSVVLGVRYAFNSPQPAPAAAVQPPAVMPMPARTYLVFFDWDRADLTDRARQIVAEAAEASTHVQLTQIEVQGNADSSGTPAYNQRLSVRRAETVAAELVRKGVPRTAIEIEAFGDTKPLVPTAPGVREPQNRRVAIILR